MSTRAPSRYTGAWERFVLAYGWRVPAHTLSTVIGQSAQRINAVRSTGACTPRKHAKTFVELFSLWHGRAPEDNEWPTPTKQGSHNTYEWQAPEVALLASLVGQLGVPQIARVLTERLRQRTSDPKATRSTNAVQVRINNIGLQSTDVIGGITITNAGRQIGSTAIVRHAISQKQLPATRVGRLLIIPHDAWSRWKAARTQPPAGHVRLSSIRDALSIKSDKLSEWARLGYIPTAVQHHPNGEIGSSSANGVWYIKKTVAEQLVADRRAGRPMPWQGKPMLDNLRTTFRLWQQRKHPDSCQTCRQIWGMAGAPDSFDDYIRRYPPLAHGAKRHLTRLWTPGLTVKEVARHVGRPESHVRRAIAAGMLASSKQGGRLYVSKTDATRWKARICPVGDHPKSWLSLDSAAKRYLFTPRELRRFIKSGALKSKVETAGPMRGIVYVSKHQCGRLRERLGFTEQEAARRVGVTVPRLRRLLQDLDWRQANRITLETVQAVVKRLKSRPGYTVAQAAKVLGVSVAWVRARAQDGTIRVSRAKWDQRRLYISEPMLQRLRAAKEDPDSRQRLGPDWLSVGQAALEAGVSIGTIRRWVALFKLARRHHRGCWRYHRDAVRACARTYWATTRYHRPTPPSWLQRERREAA